VFSSFAFVIFLLAGSEVVANNIMQLAGISQPVTQARYYLVDKQQLPIFRGNEDLWRLTIEDEQRAVFGYKVFQLSDETVLCPLEEDAGSKINNLYRFCVRLKSTEVLAMPRGYVPLDIPQSGVPVAKVATGV
jgi:hypothetical protein